ncbi:MAG: phosphoribosylglycinamide formyltransferase [Robiginitomaculum sp.]
MTTNARINTAVLISGGGTNMQALARAAQAADYPANISLVISNRPDVLGLERARALGVQAMAIDHKPFKTREGFERALDAVLRQAGIELICCAGFMRVLTPWFVSRWPGAIINIHPSLLPKYKGLHTHRRALEAGDGEHGASVHYVSEELDGGAVIAQTRVKVSADDDEQSLTRKVLAKEHRLYVQSLKRVAQALLTAR